MTRHMPETLRAECDREGRIPEEWRKLGYHFCWDWDLDLIGPEDPEFEFCLCQLEKQDDQT